jgi:hypothetical protein
MTRWYFVGMKRWFELLVVVCLCGFLSACGAGGGRDLGGGGFFCPANQYKALFKVPKNAEVITENPEELGSLDLGDYEMRTAEYLHVKKIEPNNNRRWVMFQINESDDGNGTRNTRRYCARGVQTQDASFISESPGIETMTVGEGNKVDFSPRVWGFSYNSEKLMLEQPYCKDGSSSCEISEKTSFAGKLEPGDFADATDVLAEHSEIKVVKLNKPKESSTQRYMILARTVYTDNQGIENIEVLRIVYNFSEPELVETEEDDGSIDPETQPSVHDPYDDEPSDEPSEDRDD